MNPELQDVISLARGAGEILRAGFSRRPGFGPEIEVSSKGDFDLVTEIDRRAEDYLIGQIRKRFPDHHLTTEESGELGGGDCCQWFIDPLDGTLNYAHGLSFFCVSIAYAVDGELRLSVVYDPMRDECFSAALGQGAWLNGERIRVSSTRELASSLLVTGFAYDVRTRTDNNLDNFRKFTFKTQGVRRLGSAALDLCYVAAGRLDGFWEIGLHPWDVAAGGLMVREAGGSVTNLNGQPDFLARPISILAANAMLHSEMERVLNSEDGAGPEVEA